MTQNFTVTKCRLVGTEGSSLGDGEEYDLLGGDPRIEYMERVLSQIGRKHVLPQVIS